jgi:uncharacterized membrane protein
VTKLTLRDWRAFLPALVLFALGWLPLYILGMLTWFVKDKDQFTGAGLAWGMVVTLPATAFGCLAVIGGVFYFFIRKAPD